MRQQKGFVLVSVLLITTISTMLALSQMQENRLQERIAGNQQKEINARLAAEKGIFDAFDVIAAEGDITNIEALVYEEKNYSFELIDSTSNTFTLVSKGTYQGADSYLKTTIKRSIKSTTETSVENKKISENAIIGCEGVTVGGSAKIDSFKGQSYATSGLSGNVKVIDGDINLPNGNAKAKDNKGIFGNLTAKNIYGNKNVIQGEGDDVEGYVGEAADCDPIAIATEMGNLAAEIASESAIFSSNTGEDMTLTATDGSMTLDTLADKDKNVYGFHWLEVNEQTITIDGDVTLYIGGDFTTSGSTFKLADTNSSLTIFMTGKVVIGAGSDIFADNFVTTGTDGVVRSPLTIYSSTASENALGVQGNREIYVNFYAPLGSVAYTGNVDIMGAIRAKEVNVSGNSGIHYDEGLAGIETSISSSSSSSSSSGVVKTSYCSLYYYYPEDPGTVETLEAEDYSVYCGDDLDISPFKSHAAIAGGAINITAGSTVNGDLAAQAALVIGANSVVHNIYAGAAVTTGAGSTVENIFSGAAAGIGANAIAQNIYAGAAITLGAGGQVQAVYAGAAITLGADASTTGVLTEDANADDYAEAGDIHNAGNMTDMLALITDTQSALSDLVPSPENGPLSTTMGTRTLAPGVWEGSAVSITASSTITFDADESTDNEDHVWVINLSGALTVGASTHFEIIGLDDTDTATIIWNVGAALTMGAGTSFRGTAFVGGAVTAATSSVSCGHLYATGAISIGSIGVDSEGDAVTCENSDAVFTYLEALD